VPSGEDGGSWVEDVIWTLRHLQAYICEGLPAGLPLAIRDCKVACGAEMSLLCNAGVTFRRLCARKIIYLFISAA
jgi:hypothetical protein